MESQEAEAGRELPALEITVEEALRGELLIVDVRAPSEFAEDHIPGATSVPLFSDRERAVVGTLFRHLGESEARRWGGERVHERLEPFFDEVRLALQLPREPEAPADPRPRVICCARGGERSGAVTALLRERGHPVRRLAGGYRSYREGIRARLGTLGVPGPVLLDGLTGSGKTAVLREVARLRPRQVLDLEGLARHRSSLLGDIGLVPASQKEFESGLVAAVDRLEGPWTLIEAESRRVGDREIPSSLYREMRAARRVELAATTAQRVALLHADYLGVDRGSDRPPEAAIEAVCERISALVAYPRVGEAGVRWLRERLRSGAIDEAVRFLLEEHYDPRYRHGMVKGAPALRLDRSGLGAGSIEESARRLIDWLDAEVGAGLPPQLPARTNPCHGA